MARFAVYASAAVVALSGVAQAHNYVLKPQSEFKAGSPGNGNWVEEFKPPFSGDVTNGKSFMALAKQNGFSTVRSFIENRGPDCGNTNPNAKAKAIPADGKVQLYRSMDHPGPCELWIDSKMVYHNDDCKEAWGGATPNIPVDFSACSGSCLLRFYWLGLQDKGQRMQSYKNCIPLSGSGGGGRGGNSGATNSDTNGGAAGGNAGANGGAAGGAAGGNAGTNGGASGNKGGNGGAANGGNGGGNTNGRGNGNANAGATGNNNNRNTNRNGGARSFEEEPVNESFTFSDLNVTSDNYY